MKAAAGSRERANQAHPLPAEQLDAILPSGSFEQPPCLPAWQFTQGRFAFTHAHDRQCVFNPLQWQQGALFQLSVLMAMNYKVKPGRDPVFNMNRHDSKKKIHRRGTKVMQGWRVGDVNRQALLKHRGVLGGCQSVHIISQASHDAQRVTMGRTRLVSV